MILFPEIVGSERGLTSFVKKRMIDLPQLDNLQQTPLFSIE